jgi:hypothetical protein
MEQSAIWIGRLKDALIGHPVYLAALVGAAVALVFAASALATRKKPRRQRQRILLDPPSATDPYALPSLTDSRYEQILLNKTLQFYMSKWGKSNTHVQAQIAEWDSRVTIDMAVRLVNICRDVRALAVEIVEDIAPEMDAPAKKKFRERVHARFPWVDDHNLGSLYSQAMMEATR